MAGYFQCVELTGYETNSNQNNQPHHLAKLQ